MRLEELVAHIKSSGSEMSVMLDKSTSLSTVTALIVYIRCKVGDCAENYSFDNVELTSTHAVTIQDDVISSLAKYGLSKAHQAIAKIYKQLTFT